MRILAVAVSLLVVGCAPDTEPPEAGQASGKGASTERIDALIGQLGDKEFAKRQAAAKGLEAIGEPALAALRQAAKSSDSPETRRRAEQLIQIIEPKPVILSSAYFSHGLPLAESKYPICSIKIAGRVNTKGEGKGKIELTATPPNYDEFGDLVTGDEVDRKDRPQKNERPAIALDCTIEFVKSGSVGRVNRPTITYLLFRIKGPKLTSPLMVATTGPGLTSGRLLVLGKDGRVEHVVELADRTPRPRDEGGGSERFPPCHPGCFPASTLVRVPDGTKPIERIRQGDWVTSVDSDGKPSPVRVTAVFVTRNRVLEVRTAGAKLVTTQTQPLGLEAGGFRPASELKPGDRIWRWLNGERRATAVLSVTPANREAEVFNLVLDSTKGFIAGDFLVRSKPPAPEPGPVGPPLP
jgi:hypothetical protein